MLQISDLKNFPHYLGPMLLVGVEKSYRYDDEKKAMTTEHIGNEYTVLLPHHGYSKLGVRIKDTQLLMEVQNDPEYVQFKDFTVSSWHDTIRGRATGIEKALPKK